MFSGAIKASKGISGSTPPASNPPFNYVVALLHADGTNGQTNFPITDTANTPLSLSGSATNTNPFTQGTFNPFKSAYSVDCQSSQSPIFTIPANAALAMGAGNFTIECWVNLYSTASTKCIIDMYDTTSTRLGLRINNSNQVFLSTGASLGTPIVTSTTTLSLNTWTHIAVVRSGTGTDDVKIYINGIVDASTGTSATSFTNTSYTYLCGQGPTPSFYFDGLISQLRVVKGVAVYTGNFTVPTSVLNATQSANPYGGSNTAAITGSQTSLLTFVRPYFVDLSANALSIYRGTAGANNVAYPWFTAQSPIPNATISAPTTAVAWSAASFGGSFGNARVSQGNTCVTNSTTALALGNTGNFTIEFWMYSVSSNTRQDFIDINRANNAARIDIYIHPTTLCMNVYQNGDIFTQTTAAKAVALVGTWSHIAMTRSGTTASLYWNGNRIASSTTAMNLGTTGVDAYISGPDGDIDSMLAGVRIIKGTALYAGTTYTVPTTPFTSTGTQTSMLINAGTSVPLIDYSMNQSFYATNSTVQVSTSIYKYGTSSLRTTGAFPLLSQGGQNPAITFRNGDFTVEGWFYANSGIVTKGLFQIAFTVSGTGAGQTGLALIYGTSGDLILYYGAASAVTGTAGTVTTGSWIHFAVVRSGTGTNNLKVYINGQADSALTVTDSYDYPSSFLTINTANNNSNIWTGYTDEWRISKYAVYTTNFTPPTSAFPNL